MKRSSGLRMADLRARDRVRLALLQLRERAEASRGADLAELAQALAAIADKQNKGATP